MAAVAAGGNKVHPLDRVTAIGWMLSRWPPGDRSTSATQCGTPVEARARNVHFGVPEWWTRSSGTVDTA
ncbi:hypothetical protein [Kibdelosporangium philippinense]|uniref:hypothetical protein n=1 Tax=Kibdelosporangium philippinense TaxID=211113 RepID=UPI003622E732